MEKSPVVSIIMPLYNEEKFIEKTIKSILENSYRLDRIELIIIDGMSTDNSLRIIKELTKDKLETKFFENKKRLVAFALNIGLKNASGEIFLRLDAHSKMNKDYIKNCVDYLVQGKADLVGGILVNEPYDNSILSKSIALALTSPFGVGNATHRTGIETETKIVDAVPFGCFKRELVDSVGLFNEKVNRSEDIEFYNRVKASGRKILLSSKIVVKYICNDSINMIKRYFRNGVDVTQYYFSEGVAAFKLRHLIPFFFLTGSASAFFIKFIFSSSLLIYLIFVPYFILAFFFSLKIAIKSRAYGVIPVAPLVFFTLHIVHGFGAIAGIFIGKFSKKGY